MIEKFNVAVFEYINRFAGLNPSVDNVAKITAGYMPFVFVLGLAYLWFSRQGKQRHIALYGGYAAIVGLTLNLLITSLYFHPRPFMLSLGTLLVPHAPETSFPSDHTTLMLSIAFALACFERTRKMGILFAALGLLGGTARVFCGLHFPLDILGSAGVALVSAFVVRAASRKLSGLNDKLISWYDKVLETVIKSVRKFS